MIDLKNVKAETTAITRQKDQFYAQTGNIYETVAILSKRANQISSQIKEELTDKIKSYEKETNDTMEETFENREQIDIARFYERLPKPTLIAIEEFLDEKIYFRNPVKEVNGGF